MYNYSIPLDPLLPFISNEKLYKEVEEVLSKIDDIKNRSASNLYKNVIDPFSALFESIEYGLTLDQWIQREKARQSQKSLQNLIGEFHQSILGDIDGWENLGTSHVIDLRNETLRVIAEVKNKFNTTKGNHKTSIYDDLKYLLDTDYKGYIGYYIEIIPPNKKKYDKPFVPSDNVLKKRRPEREDIRVIDGKSFYYKVTGNIDALRYLYETLPIVISSILGKQNNQQMYITDFMSLFERAY